VWIPLCGGVLSVAIVAFATLPQLAVGVTALGVGAALYALTRTLARGETLRNESFIQEV
jgi:hypothetical protein